MSWFTKSPFGREEDPVQHMVELLSAKAEKDGTPLTESDRAILVKEISDVEPVPEDLKQRAKALIARMFVEEPWDEFESDSKSFGSSLQWAGDLGYTNIVSLAEEVASEFIGEAFTPLQGWKLAKDRMQLIGCGVLTVLLMFAIGIGASFLFGWK
jgi:hypothetical protein